MIIAISPEKYRVGSNRGIIALDEPGILNKLNSIIEWKWCKFPKRVESDPNDKEKTVTVEIKDFLGDEPSLQPGNIFLFDGNVIAVDSPDRLVLILSETGPYALKRIYDEVIKTELDYFFGHPEVNNVILEPISSDKIPDNFKKMPIPYKDYTIWCERYKFGRENTDCLKATLESDSYLFPLVYFIKDSYLYYDPDCYIEEDNMLEDACTELFAGIYCLFDRVAVKKEKEDN